MLLIEITRADGKLWIMRHPDGTYDVQTETAIASGLDAEELSAYLRNTDLPIEVL
jgi:hypothetical protein